MNKYVYILIAAIAIMGVGIVAKKSGLTGEATKLTGETREITITAKKNEWSFTPDLIEVNKGDKVVLTIINEDDYDHGVAIDAYGISQRIPARGTITAEFTATRAGDFPFYCSVPCGEGEVDGKTRTHFDQVGKIRVKDLLKMDTDTEEEVAQAQTYIEDVLWADALKLLKGGRVEMATQTHDLTVTFKLKTGQTVRTKEPAIDEMFKEIESCGEACKDIVIATE